MKNLLAFLLFLSFSMALPERASGQTEPMEAPRPQMNFFVETARPTEQIQHDFPYDIQLLDAAGDTLLSNAVFEKNGKPTVLLFWLTTCMPCRHELKAISEKYLDWQQQADFNLYAVSVDFPKNFPSFQQRVEEAQWPFPAYNDVNREFMVVMPGNLNGLPQVFVLDGEGNIVHHTRRYAPGDEDKLFEEVRELAK